MHFLFQWGGWILSALSLIAIMGLRKWVRMLENNRDYDVVAYCADCIPLMVAVLCVAAFIWNGWRR